MNKVLLHLLLRRHGASCCACALPPILIGTVMGFLFPVFREEHKLLAPALNFAKRFMPRDIRAVDFFSPAGAFAWGFMHPLTLVCFAVAAAVPMLALPAGERGRGNLDLLMATPLGRRELVTTLLGFAVPVGIVLALSPWIGSLTGAAICDSLDDVPAATYGLVSLNAFGLTLLLAAMALFISVGARDRAVATVRYVALMVTFFLTDMAAGLWREGEWLKLCSPLGYYEPSSVIADPGELSGDLSVLFAATALLLGASLWLESRRQSV